MNKSRAEILRDNGFSIGFRSTYTWDCAMAAMQEYADQECAELRRQMDELRAAKPDIIVPGEEEIRAYAFSTHPFVSVGRSQGANWAINRIKELNK